MTTALITGVAGQDGIYLARRLLSVGTRVVGTVLPGGGRAMTPYLVGVEVVEHDVRDTAGFRKLLEQHAPDEVYNLAAVSSVGLSWADPESTTSTNGAAVAGMLEVLTDVPGTRWFQAASAEEHGNAPDSPYARSKAEARRLTTEARERHGLFACSGVLYNHESPLRAQHFVTRKITRAAAEISLGKREQVALGDLEVSRDWGHARDYVDAMMRMLRRDTPQDFVLATGTAHSIGDLLVEAFGAVGIDDPWPYVVQDPELVRPADTAVLVGDPSAARDALGWTATTTFHETIADMVEIDVCRVRSGIEEDLAYLG